MNETERRILDLHHYVLTNRSLEVGSIRIPVAGKVWPQQPEWGPVVHVSIPVYGWSDIKGEFYVIVRTTEGPFVWLNATREQFTLTTDAETPGEETT